MTRETGGELGVGGAQKPGEGVYFKKHGTVSSQGLIHAFKRTAKG